MDTVVDDPLYARLFACAPVYDPVFACLSPLSLVRVALTCRAAYLAVAGFKTRAFNINRHLSRYFSDPVAFRSLQAKTNTLVSGSNALQFLDRTFYPEADLDIYTHPGHSFEVARFLVEAEGYRYTPRESQEQDWKEVIGCDWDDTEQRVVPEKRGLDMYPMSDVNAVWTFEKTGDRQESLTIQIIEALSSPFETVLGFHSTCVMNFISSDAAYSLYPIATFENRRSLGMPSLRHFRGAIKKYVERGWDIYFAATPNDMACPMNPPFFLEQVRWVFDKYAWRLPLEQSGVMERPPLNQNSVPLISDPVLFNGWKLRRYSRWIANQCECYYHSLRTTAFRYNHATPEETSWFTNVQGRYHGQVSAENRIWFDADIPGFFQMK